MSYCKFTEGYVKQVFNDSGECINQTFHAAGDITYENPKGIPLDLEDLPLEGDEYFPFDMVQP